MRKKRRLALPPVLVAPILLVGLLAPAADAARGECLPGQKQPKCQLSKAKIVGVTDGDTVSAKIKQGSSWSKRTQIRLTAVQAMELTEFGRRSGRSGECHSVEAAERLEQLIRTKTVRLAALRSGGQLRGIAFKQGGSWTDVGSVLIREGHALWDPHPREWAWNKRYAKLAGQAAGRGARLWDTDSCDAGPAPASGLELKVKWDADGPEGKNVNGEFVRISNTSANPVSLAGWWVRDSFDRRYKFRSGTSVPPGGSIEMHVGRGQNDANTFFWGLRSPVFENVVRAKGIGDGAYLFDPDGDLRVWRLYPCYVDCAEPLKGKVDLTVNEISPESAQIANTSTGAIDLSEYEVESAPYFYEFTRGTVLQAGETLTLVVEQDPSSDTQFMKGWGFNQPLFGDKKDVVTLRNPLGAPVVCDAWGGARCPKV